VSMVNHHWIELNELEEEARQTIANLTDSIEGLSDKMNGLSWAEIYQLSEIKALVD
jgi:hypothetical protein